MFKLALCAGHGKNTAGKRCLKTIDKNETREWVLNSRICEKLQKKLTDFDGIEIKRMDDVSGKTDIALSTRTKTANLWGADLYLSIHHNAGIKGGEGGGIVAFTYQKVDDETKDWQKEFYDALIDKTGLNGDRAVPLATKNLAVCRDTAMPAVLLELGFMDSKTDTPIILTEEFAEKCASALTEVIVRKAALKQKTADKPVTQKLLPKINYQVYIAGKKWLPKVEGETDYAGLPARPIQALFVDTNVGDIEYAVHTKGGRWLPFVKNREDYAGIFGKYIDCVRVRLIDNEKYSVECRVAAVGRKYYPWVRDDKDYAGVYGKKIDRLQIRLIEK